MDERHKRRFLASIFGILAPMSLHAQTLEEAWTQRPQVDFAVRARIASRGETVETDNDLSGYKALLEKIKAAGDPAPLAPGIMAFTKSRKIRTGKTETVYSLSVIISDHVKADFDVVKISDSSDGRQILRQRTYYGDESETLLGAKEGIIISRRNPISGTKEILSTFSRRQNPNDSQTILAWKDLVVRWLAWEKI